MSEEKKASLWSMIQKMIDLEDELILMSDEDIKKLFSDLKGKVDGTHFVLQKLKAEEQRLAEVIKAHQDRKKTVQNAQKRLKSYAAKILNDSDTPQLFGVEWDMKVTTSKSVRLIREPQCTDEIRFPNLIRTKIEWDKAKLKSMIEKDGELSDIAVLETNHSIKFTSHKEK